MDPPQQWIESLLPAILESTLPVFVQVSLEHLDRLMEVAGERELARRFTEKEFQQVVSGPIQQRSRSQLSNLTVEIHGDGFLGKGTINLETVQWVVSAKLGIKVVEERPHIVLRQMKVGSFDVSRATLQLMEKQVNRFIDSQQYPLWVKEFQFNERWVWVSVERA